MASKELNVKVKHRYDTASNWIANNPVLLAGELGIESDTNKMKIGDGTKNWSSLEYIFKDNSADKMDKVNPTGSGSFSLNRLAESSVGDCSFAEGYNCTAGGLDAHAEGYYTKANGRYSHAEGNQTTATSDSAHAEGQYTYASGVGSHSSGIDTYAKRRAHFVFGEGNLLDSVGSTSSDKGQYIEIVGNGTYSNRSNARTLDWEGNQWLAGNLQAQGLTDGTTTKSMSEILAGGGSKITWREWN